VEARAIAADLNTMLEIFTRQAIGDQSIRLFGSSVNAHDITQSVLDRIREWFGQSDDVATVAGYSLAAVMGGFLTMVLLFYFLASGERVARGLFWIVPPHRRPLVARIWRQLDPVLMRYFIGVLVIVAYATVAAYVGLGVILGIRHAVLLALLTGVLEIVPVIGPTAAAILAGLVSLRTATGIVNIAEYALYATLLRLSIDQLVGPVVLGRAAHVHPVLIIFCFLAGGVVFGIPGVILAVPVALVFKSTLATLYGDE
jgi:predicted PurR-regulated permease PerM